MTELTKNGCQFIEDTLVAAAAYGGNQTSMKKQISASQLGNDDLQLYLKYMHGGKDGAEFEANTFGSIYHLGAEKAFAGIPDVETEMSMKYMLPNGWLVTGSVDLILHKYKVIADHKTTTATSIASTIKDGKNSSYGLQMAVYKLLLSKERNLHDYSAVLPMVDKSFSYFKKNKYNQLTFVDMETFSVEDTERLLVEKTNRLQEFIDLGQEPAECANLFWYGPKGGKRKRMRCIHYCDQSNNCPYYKDSTSGVFDMINQL